jgi:radical SAM superfamily enzyme YgiQ (UPF0313 family)
MTSRGCPYRCIFCHNIFGKRFRKRSIDHVMAELEQLRGMGIRSIEVYDDNFNLDAGHMRGILQEIIRRRLNLELYFPNALRADLLSDDDVRLLKEAGTVYLVVAVETASPRLQRLIKKNLDLDKTARVIRTAARLRIFTAGYFMLGFPTETRAEMEATVDFACRSPLHAALFFTVVPHPSTELGRMVGIDECDAPIDEWDYILGRNIISAEPPEVVNYLQRRAFRRFYLSPRRALRVLRDLPGYEKLWFIARRTFGVARSFTKRNQWTA